MLEVDSLYGLLGNPGRYHIGVYLLLCLNYFPMAFNHLAMMVYSATPKHHCRPPEGDLYNDSFVVTDGKIDQCRMYVNASAENETSECQYGWIYQFGYDRENTVVMEWDLVCQDKYLISLATTIYFTGVMIGGLIYGALSDRFGRKPCVLTSLYLQAALGVALFFCTSYLQFVVLRFFLGILIQGLQTSTFVLISEMFTSRHRTVVCTITEIFWSGGVMSLAGLAFLLRDWRYIQLAISAPSVLTIVYIWLVPESVRWLVSQKKYKKVESILRVAAKFNKVELADDLLGSQDMNMTQLRTEDNTKRHTILDMFRTSSIRLRTFVLSYLWLGSAIVYYGISLNISDLAGNKYLNFFISGAAELPAYIIAVYIIGRFGRRIPMCIYLLIGGVACITAGTVPSATGGDLSFLPTVLALTGKFGVAGCFSVLFLYTSELYPTVIRNLSVGACAFWARVGGVIAPQILYMGQFTYSFLPIVIFGSIALLGAFLVLLLPETRGKKLPDTIEEAETMVTKATPSANEMTESQRKDVAEYLLNGEVKKETFI